MKLTKQEAIKLHREMWRRISELSDEEIEVYKKVGRNKIKCMFAFTKLKNKVIRDMGIEEVIYNGCFCCEYAKSGCSKCPIDWWYAKCYNSNTLYSKAVGAFGDFNFDKFRNLAKQISELPERKLMHDE